MPVVPFSPGASAASPKGSDAESIDPSYLLMAAAQMHSMGRLFEPEPTDAMDRSPLEIDKGTSSKDVMTPQKMMDNKINLPEAIYNDSGQIVDLDTKPRKRK